MTFNRFEEIEVWKQSRSLVKEIYVITSQPMFSKDFSFKDQIRRSALSIPSNFAEGYERKSNKEFIRFLFIAKGSAGELRTQVHIAKDLNYIDDNIYNELINKSQEISKSLSGFIKYLQTKI